MEITQKELDELMKIQKEVQKELQNDAYYNKLKNRKKQILNYLTIMPKLNEKKISVEKYEEIGKQIKKIEIEMAYKLASSNKIKMNTKKNILDKIIEKFSFIKVKNKNDNSYDEQFNKIVKNSKYKKKINIRREIFRKLIRTNSKEKNLLYELEKVEIELATIETDKIREFINKKQ